MPILGTAFTAARGAANASMVGAQSAPQSSIDYGAWATGLSAASSLAGGFGGYLQGRSAASDYARSADQARELGNYQASLAALSGEYRANVARQSGIFDSQRTILQATRDYEATKFNIEFAREMASLEQSRNLILAENEANRLRVNARINRRDVYRQAFDYDAQARAMSAEEENAMKVLDRQIGESRRKGISDRADIEAQILRQGVNPMSISSDMILEAEIISETREEATASMENALSLITRRASRRATEGRAEQTRQLGDQQTALDDWLAGIPEWDAENRNKIIEYDIVNRTALQEALNEYNRDFSNDLASWILRTSEAEAGFISEMAANEVALINYRTEIETGNLQRAREQALDQANASLFGGAGGAAGAGVGFAVGGPVGGLIGAGLGSAVGSIFGGLF